MMTLVTLLPPSAIQGARWINDNYIPPGNDLRYSEGRFPRDSVAPAEPALENTAIVTAPPVYTVLPFAAMLLAIAICPLRIPHWWEANRHKFIVSLVLGAPVLVLYLRREPGALLHMLEEYVSFIVMLAGLYVISGGIRLRGD